MTADPPVPPPDNRRFELFKEGRRGRPCFHALRSQRFAGLLKLWHSGVVDGFGEAAGGLQREILPVLSMNWVRLENGKKEVAREKAGKPATRDHKTVVMSKADSG